MQQWCVYVAGQPVFVPGVAFVSRDSAVSRDPCAAWARDFPDVEAALQTQEFSAVVIVAGGRLWLRFLDRGTSPALCGHATLGVLGLFAELGCTEHTLSLWTPAGQIQGTITDEETYDIRMTSARAHPNTSTRWGALAECGNRFVVCHHEALQGDLAQIQERARAPIEAGVCYGVLFYDFVTCDQGGIEVLSVTVFGRALQVDRSPCGTGSCALAAQLAQQKLLRTNQHLRNRALNGEVFEVKLAPREPDLYEPVLSFKGAISITSGHRDLDHTAHPRWHLLPLSAAWNTTKAQPAEGS